MTATVAVTGTQQASAELERRAAAVVAAVHAVDVTAAPGTVEAVLVEVAPTPHKRARIVRHLHEHPDALTAGSSATPKLVGALIAALVEAGVTGLVVPTCADCGLPLELFHTRGRQRICRRCYERRQSGTQTCGGCGKRCRAHGRAADGTPLCQVCQHNSRAIACSGCGRVRPVSYSRRDGKPYCRGCRARNQLEPCTGCGNLRPVNTRDPDGRGYCGSCYVRAKSPEVCGKCGAIAPVAERRGDGAAICASCHALPIRVCGTCGRTRRVALKATATSPDLCPTCYQAPEITCSVCGDTALGRRTTADGRPMCFRCQACRRVDAALTGPEGTIPETLWPVRDAIVHADNPRSVLSNFTQDKAMVLLTAIARGERPLSHDALDEHAGRSSVEYLRSLLVAAAALPARDEHLQRLQRFATALLDTVDNAADRRLLAAFCRWHLLARLRRRTIGALTPHAAYRCRGDLTAAHRFLVFLRDRDHDPASCTQDDIDTWFAQPTQHTVDASRGFLGLQLRLGGTAITVPPPLDELLTLLLATRPRGIAARLHHGDWLFPGRRPGHHLHATRLAQRLRALGVDPRADRNTALLQLAAEVPPAVLADLLGLHIGTAISWANEAGGDWTNYAAIRATADIPSHQSAGRRR